MDAPEALPAVGDFIEGRYLLEARVLDHRHEEASDWPTTVWQATDTVLDRDVTLKLLRPGLLGDDAAVEAFQTEGRLAAHVRHPNALVIYDTISTDDTEAIVTERIEGESLRHRLASIRAQPVTDAVQYFDPLAATIERAHRNEVIHGNLRPEVVRFRPNGQLMVTDFAAHEPPAAFTYSGPESEADPTPSVAGDVYSLGAILYELLSGHRPDRHTGEPQRLHHRAAVAWPVADVVMRALHANPEQRYASVDAFRSALAAAAAQPDAATPRLGSDDRPRAIVAIGAVLFIGMLALALWLVLFRGSDDASAGAVLATATAEPTEQPTVAPTPQPTATSVTPTATSPPTRSPSTPTPIPLPQPFVVRATGFDPPPGSGGEGNELAAFLIDELPNSIWTTEAYGSADFGGLKTGVGFYLELAEAVPVNTIEVRSPTQQWVAQVYLAIAPGPSLSTWGDPVVSIVQTPDRPGIATATFASEPAGAVLVWFTTLGPLATGGFGVEVSEVNVSTN